MRHAIVSNIPAVMPGIKTMLPPRRCIEPFVGVFPSYGFGGDVKPGPYFAEIEGMNDDKERGSRKIPRTVSLRQRAVRRVSDPAGLARCAVAFVVSEGLRE